MGNVNKKNWRKSITLLSLLFSLLFLNIVIASTAGHFITKWNKNDTLKNCGSYNGYTLKQGVKGSCYYIDENDKYKYVEKESCNCNKAVKAGV